MAESLLLGPSLSLIRYGNFMKLQRLKLGFLASLLSFPICATAKEEWIDVLYLATDLRANVSLDATSVKPQGDPDEVQSSVLGEDPGKNQNTGDGALRDALAAAQVVCLGELAILHAMCFKMLRRRMKTQRWSVFQTNLFPLETERRLSIRCCGRASVCCVNKSRSCCCVALRRRLLSSSSRANEAWRGLTLLVLVLPKNKTSC